MHHMKEAIDGDEHAQCDADGDCGLEEAHIDIIQRRCVHRSRVHGRSPRPVWGRICSSETRSGLLISHHRGGITNAQSQYCIPSRSFEIASGVEFPIAARAVWALARWFLSPPPAVSERLYSPKPPATLLRWTPPFSAAATHPVPPTPQWESPFFHSGRSVRTRAEFLINYCRPAIAHAENRAVSLELGVLIPRDPMVLLCRKRVDQDCPYIKRLMGTGEGGNREARTSWGKGRNRRSSLCIATFHQHASDWGGVAIQ